MLRTSDCNLEGRGFSARNCTIRPAEEVIAIPNLEICLATDLNKLCENYATMTGAEIKLDRSVDIKTPGKDLSTSYAGT
jgi:hypothetical protein